MAVIHPRGMSEGEIAAIMSGVDKMLRHPSCVIETVRGIVEVPSSGPWMEYAPSGRQTITFTVNELT